MAALVGALAAVVTTALAYATRRRESLLGADEGYLWYGTQRLLAREQPVRDFRAYEPGRYWWTGLVARSLGRGVVPVRLASHLAAGGALVVLAIALGTAGAPPLALAVLPAVVIGWRSVHYKLIDSAMMLLVAAGGVALLSDADGAAFWLGLVIGLAGVTGLNLGAYAVVAGTAVTAVGLAAGTVAPSALLALGTGGVVGAAPLLLWFVRHPGTLRAVWQARVVVPRERGSTNLPLPTPWPWRRDAKAHGATTPTTEWIVRLGFVAVPLISLGCLAASTAAALDAATIAPVAAVGLVTFHHAMSRADLAHLQLPAPFALACLALLPGALGVAGSLLAVSATVPIVLITHPRLRRRRNPRAFERRRLLDDQVWLPRGMALQLDAVRGALAPGEALAAIPLGLPIVAALDLRSAVHDTYCVYPADAAADEELRSELDAARPVLVLVDTRPVSGNDAAGFPQTHPRTWAWLQEVGTRVETGPLPSSVSLWRVAQR